MGLSDWRSLTRGRKGSMGIRDLLRGCCRATYGRIVSSAIQASRTTRPVKDVVLLEGRHSGVGLDGEDAAVVKRKRLGDRDRLLGEAAIPEQDGQLALLDGQGRSWVEVIEPVGQLVLGHGPLRSYCPARPQRMVRPDG